MMERLAAWWRARTPREQVIVRGGAFIVGVIVLPVWLYLSALSYRADGAAELAAARQLEANVARLAEASAAAPAQAGGDQSLRGKMLAAAQTTNLVVARSEASGDRERIVFEAANSLAVYRWIELVGQGGAFVARTDIVRVEGGDLVRAEFEVAPSP